MPTDTAITKDAPVTKNHCCNELDVRVIGWLAVGGDRHFEKSLISGAAWCRYRRINAGAMARNPDKAGEKCVGRVAQRESTTLTS